MDILSHLSSSPVTVNSLMKATGLSATALTLGLVELGGKVTIQDGGIVLSPEPVKPSKAGRPTGPRGPIARTAPRHQAARQALTLLAGSERGTNALEVLASADGRYNYADIIKVARDLTAEGLIVESRKGRKCTWTLPA